MYFARLSPGTGQAAPDPVFQSLFIPDIIGTEIYAVWIVTLRKMSAIAAVGA